MRKPSKLKPYSWTLYTKPVPKGRPRMTRSGHVFTPKRTLEAEAIIAGLYKGPKYEGLVGVDIKFYVDKIELTITPLPDRVPSKIRGDLDNLVKLVLDALNGVAYLDDRQCVVIKVEKV